MPRAEPAVRRALEVETWVAARYWLACIPPRECSGYVYRGLGLRHEGWAHNRKQTLWRLIHLGSGLNIAVLRGDVRAVFPVASEVAECGDFTLFDLPDGWRQTDPDLQDKVKAILAQHPSVVVAKAPNKGTAEDTRAMIAAREAAAVASAAAEGE